MQEVVLRTRVLNLGNDWSDWIDWINGKRSWLAPQQTQGMGLFQAFSHHILSYI